MVILPAAIIFLAALLLFQVQPLAAKMVLPWFGGGAAVWTACMLFFQSMLLAGYAYSHWLSRALSNRGQVLVHAALLTISLFFLPIVPADALQPLPGENPTLGVLVLMLATVGLPFFLLAASSPLLQYWFTTLDSRKSVYRFYALSNFGSLLGLLAYPFMLEPLLGLSLQSIVWSCAYLLFVLISAAYARLVFGQAPPVNIARPENTGSPPAPWLRVLWLALPACGSLLLLATTSRITQDVAPMPLLWVLPLALYLVSFTVSFDHERWYDRRLWIPLFAVALTAAVWLLYSSIFTDIRLRLAVLAAAMFVACMVCHGELFRLRPDPAFLTRFYLYVAVGGALGGVFAAVAAPVIFTDLWEYHIGLVLVVILLLVVLLREHRSLPPNPWRAGGIAVIGMGLAALSIALVQHALAEGEGMIVTKRNFYGVVGVAERNKNTAAWRRDLWHGTVRHGGQLMWPRYRDHTTSYYGPSSGAGLSLRFHPAAAARGGLKVGAIGLGVGTVAQYLMAADTIRFYEIDPHVTQLAKDYFTYLQQTSAEVEIVMGDARLSLARELAISARQNFDVLIVDAFNSDAVPVHLMTREAFELYWQHLRPDGILAVHTTALHVNFEPLVRDLALTMGKRAVLIRDPGRERGAAHSVWVLVTNNERFLDHATLRKHPRVKPGTTPSRTLWTDDYSNVLPYLVWKTGR